MLSALPVRPDRRPAAAGTGSAECRRSPARRGSLRVRLLRAWGPAGPRAPDQVAGDQRWFPSCRHLRQRFRGGWGRRGGDGGGGAGALDPTGQLLRPPQKIGRGACRGRGEISGVAGSLKKKKKR